MDFIGMGKVYTDRIIICNKICPSNGWDRERARELTNELREETVLAWKKKKQWINQKFNIMFWQFHSGYILKR